MTHSGFDLVSRGPSSTHPGSNEHVSTVAVHAATARQLKRHVQHGASHRVAPYNDKVGNHSRAAISGSVGNDTCRLRCRPSAATHAR